MYSDKVDIEQHIEFNQTGLEKLQKIITKQTVLKQKQEENLGSQVKQVKQMDEQLDILKSEKQDAIKEIEINKEELERLKVELNAKKAMIGTKEEDIANIDHEID
jgi:chromosome segregation ATPase